ncbi:MAG TPA: hypothetical protein VMU72_09955 [Gaiellaceae bacterium]|nr:hypothetical protein [Gaiellaceae bacterium]
MLVLAVVLLAMLTSAVSSRGAASPHRSSPFAGLGTWVDIYSTTALSDPEAAVASMARHGVRTLYFETGNYSHNAAVVWPDAASRFIDAAHAAGLRVVAWYLPAFLNVRRDLRRALGAIRFRSATGERFDGFALDIEATSVRSLALRDHRLLFLSTRLHLSVPSKYPLGAITPSPVGMSPYFWPDIPYSSLTRYYKAFLPMAYFTMRGIHSRSGASAFLTSTVSQIRAASGHPRFPVHLIGGLSGKMGPQATAGFMRAVTQTKLLGFSLYDFDEMTPAVWRALAPSS